MSDTHSVHTPEYCNHVIKHAATNQAIQFIRSLTDWSKFDEFGDTLLTSACMNGREAIALELLKYDCRPLHVNNAEDTAFSLACENNMTAFIQEFCKLYPDGCDHVNMYNETPLELCCQNENVQAAFYVIATNNCFLEHEDDDGNTALILACKYNMPLIASAIMYKLKEKHKLKQLRGRQLKHYIRHRNNLGYSAMTYAVHNCMPRTIQKLSKYAKRSPVTSSYTLPDVSPIVSLRSPITPSRSPVTPTHPFRRASFDHTSCTLPKIDEN